MMLVIQWSTLVTELSQSLGLAQRGFKFTIEYSNALGPLTPKHVHLLPTIFFQFHLKQRWGMHAKAGRSIVYTNTDK